MLKWNSTLPYPCTKIYLVGLPGSGKSTLAKEISSVLNWAYLDTDQLIEEQYGSIPSIFEKRGEDQFRLLEQSTISKLQEKKQVVIATGGGLPCFNQQINVLLDTGLVLFLDTPLKHIIKRMAKNHGDRPLLKSDRKEKLIELDKERRPVYLRSHLQLIPPVSADDLYTLKKRVLYGAD